MIGLIASTTWILFRLFLFLIVISVAIVNPVVMFILLIILLGK